MAEKTYRVIQWCTGVVGQAALRHFMDAQGRENLAHPDSEAWTLPQELRVISWLAGRRIGAGGD